jgi:SAM-dependent methyltransferase
MQLGPLDHVSGPRRLSLDRCRRNIDALAAAARVSQQLSIKADFICAGAESLPFRDATADLVFCYSVLQHLERSTVQRFFADVVRVLKPGGVCLVQLPNTLGLFNLARQGMRGFRDAMPGTFERRYWNRRAIRNAVEAARLKNLRVRADGFFSQNPQLVDRDLLSLGGKLVVLASEAGRKISTIVPVLTRVADSLWIEGRVWSAGQARSVEGEAVAAGLWNTYYCAQSVMFSLICAPSGRSLICCAMCPETEISSALSIVPMLCSA